MKGQMKRYLGMKGWAMFLTGAFVLSSCAEDEVVEKYAPNTDGESISFSISKANPTWEPDSRAVVESGRQNFVLRSEETEDTLCVSARTEYSFQDVQSRGTLVTDKSAVTSFEVFSNFYTQSQPNVSSFYFMKNEQVSDGVNPSKAYYWPPADCNLDFIALAPYKAGRTWKSEDTDGNPIAPQLTYTVDDDVTKHEDLMIAKTDKMNLGNSTNASVPLSFNHILASVQFAFGDMPEGIVKSISISGPLSKTGTYTVGGNWINNNAESVTYTIAADAGVATTQDVNGKKIVNEKIITLPQSFASETLTLTVVFNDNSAGVRTLTAKIPAGEWAQGTTTTYTISISPAYDLQFTTTQESIPVKDCHYDIQQLKINTGGVYTGRWAITSDKTWATIRVLPTRDENNLDLYYQGYWCIDDRGNTILTGESITTNGIDLLVYLYENTEDTNYDTREVTITLNAINDKNEYIPIATRKIKQYEPLWNDGKAYERIEEFDSETVFPWGFNWSNTQVTFTASRSYLRGILFNIFKLFGYGNNVNMSLNGSSATISMSNIKALGTTASDPNDGKNNTQELLNFEGIDDLNASISLLEGWGMTLDEESIETQPTNYAVRMILYKNKFNKKTETTGGKTVNVAVLTSDGVEWYLPAPGEVSTLASTAADNISTNNDTPLYTSNTGYWSSQAVANSNTNSFYYTSSGSVDTSASRTLQKRVRAARIKPQ